jgi:molecular chaperone DnaK
MVKEAGLHAEEDKKKRDVVDARNQLDGLVYQTEKTLAEHGGSLDPGTRSNIDGALSEAKQALESQDASRMRSAADALARASHKLAEAMYAKAAQGGGAGGPTAGGPTGEDGAASGGGKEKEDVVEAEFEEVKE